MAGVVQQKLHKVMQQCSHIAKKGQNEFHGYSYVTSSDVMEKVNQAFSEVGLVTTASASLVDLREVQTAKGNIDKLATVMVDVTIYDVDTEECLVFTGLGSGQDSGDKAIMKAQTAALKYAYMMSLCIATNDDPEADMRVDMATTTEEAHKSANGFSIPVVTPKGQLSCQDCGAKITAKVEEFSKNRYGKALCMECQKSGQRIA